jgi:hypothetical protein
LICKYTPVQQKFPTLIIGYNRRDLLQRQVEICVKLERQFLLAIDGPKSSKDFSAIETREYAIRLEKECKTNLIATLIRETNLGCRMGVNTAISWAFSKYNSLIVLEDDVDVDQRFFDFMDFGLAYFEGDKEVFTINGWCPLSDTEYLDTPSYSYFKSAFIFASGWATWSDRWKLVDHELTTFKSKSHLRNLPTVRSKKLGYLLTRVIKLKLKQCLDGLDTWDYPVLYSMWRNGSVSITPTRRLTGNLGFDARATHTHRPPSTLELNLWDIPTKETNTLDLSEPNYFELGEQVGSKLDLLIGKKIFGVYSGNSLMILVNSIKRLIIKKIKVWALIRLS